MNNATMLYRSASEPNPDVWGLNVEWTIVDEADIEAMEAQGWHRHPHDAAKDEKTLLDKTAVEISEALPSLSDEDLLKLLDDETAGKTRKGVLAAIEAEAKRRQG